MKFLIVVLFILSVCAVSFASEAVGFFRDPAHPGKCVYENLILSPGEEAKIPNDCGRILCGDDGFATIQTCGVMGAPPGCKYTDYIDINAPYAECCERKLVC
ncbi:uncharacterized protein ACRADG_012538 [Cochliomyia hominivorax]